MTLTIIAASAFLLLQTAKGSIEGVVINSVTNRPIANAQVTGTRIPTALAAPAGAQVPGGVVRTSIAGGVLSAGAAPQIVAQPNGNPVQPTQITPAKTDANGQFAFRDLEPGTYLLRASAEGYAQQEFNGRPGGQGGMSATVNLTAGQSVAGTILRLTPGGNVSGRVTGSNGEPLANIEVSLFRGIYDGDGRKTFQQSGSAQTNDRGEYRLFWVTPGMYYLSAASSNRPMPGVPFNPAAFTNKYPRTFYPAAQDIASAAPIDVQPANELGGMDFRLTEQATFRVRGRVILPSSGEAPPRFVSVSIMLRDSIILSGMFSPGSPYNAADGTFELRDVPSGSYMIRAQLPINGPPQPGQPPPIPQIATAAVDVRGADVDGVVLTFVPPMSISGRIRVEGESTPQNLRATILFRPASGGLGIGPGPRPAQANPDGTFNVEGIGPGEYRVSVNAPFAGNQAGMYVKEMRFGPVDLRVQPLVISTSVSDTIEVVFAKDAGQISGTVHSGSQQPGPGVQVALIPDDRARHDLYKFTITNANGQFTFRSVPASSYKVFAWEYIEQNSWLDPTILARYESSGMATTINPSSNVTLELRVIPAATPR